LIGGSPSDINAEILHDAQMRVLKPLIDRGDIRIVSDTPTKAAATKEKLHIDVVRDGFREPRNDSEELAEGKVAPVDLNRRSAQPIISDPRR